MSMNEKPKLYAVPKSDAITPAAIAASAAETEIDVLARTLWGEARGEGVAGMQAVACVILNRAEISKRRPGYWWGRGIVDICQKPKQFSCWNRTDANYHKLLQIDDQDIHFASAKRIARRARLGFLKDETRGATHYHARGILPAWAKNRPANAVIGRHVFYKLEG